ncbi:MAG TPA: methyltransferase domain-containing protein, partial [Candidatus Hodarchaeales archaeon]|nr:methyltransferase domain-containing protein [Candidatus Hodarchaeales archaeon]
MSFAHKVSGFNRQRKWTLFLQEIAPHPDMRILDVGFSDIEYSPNDNFIENHYPYPEKLTALGVDEPNNLLKRYPRVNAVQYSGDIFPFSDKEFDVCWSNAVIEHVGNQEKQLIFLREIKRVSRKAFITTPNRYFPIETHTRTPLLHYLPKKSFELYLSVIGKKWASGEYMHLLSIN